MIKQIDIFTPEETPYGVFHYLISQIQSSLKNLGIQSRTLHFHKDILRELLEQPPECTLSFNNLYSDHIENVPLLAEVSKIPHLTYLMQPPHHVKSIVKSPYNIFIYIDRQARGFLETCCGTNLIFMPPGIEKNIHADIPFKKNYDVVFSGTCIDYEDIRHTWRQKYPLELRQILDEAAEILLTDNTHSIYEAFIQTLLSDPIRQASINLNTHGTQIFNELELYVCGKSRMQLIRSIKDVNVTIFGKATGKKNWQNYLSDKKNITIHKEGLPINEMLNVLKQSHIVLDSSPTIQDGVHERVLMGMANGSLVMTEENEYLKECFKENESIVFYRKKELNSINESIHTYLSDLDRCQMIGNKGREIVEQFHTWDERIKHLVTELNRILKKQGSI